MTLDFLDPQFNFTVYDNDDSAICHTENGKLYSGADARPSQELNPAYTTALRKLEGYGDYELRGFKILLDGRGKLEFNFKKDSVDIAEKTATGFFSDTYTKVGYIKYKDAYTNRQSLRLDPKKDEETLKLVSHLTIKHLEQKKYFEETVENTANDDGEESKLAA